MKKVTDFLKPNILIIFGALLFLYYLNYLQGEETTLAIGIIAVILSAYYIAVGVLGVVAGNKLSAQLKVIFEVVSVCLFAVFMFLIFLLTTINAAKIEGFMGPTAWTIAVLSMIAALALAIIYPVARLTNVGVMVRLAYLFSAIFALALLLDILFTVAGNGINLGGINVILTCIYIIFTFYLFNSLVSNAAQAPAKKEEQAE